MTNTALRRDEIEAYYRKKFQLYAEARRKRPVRGFDRWWRESYDTLLALYCDPRLGCDGRASILKISLAKERDIFRQYLPFVPRPRITSKHRLAKLAGTAR